MASEIGFLKLHRCLMKKPIWLNSTPEQKTILITVLMMVNFSETSWEWKGEKFTTQPGQTITSIDSIMKYAGKGITIQNVRSSLLRFEKLGFLTNESTKTGRLITIVNWRVYQPLEDKPNIEDNIDPTNTQQTPNKEPTPKGEGNKGEGNKGEEEKEVIPYKQIIDYLNDKTNSKYKMVDKNKKFIKARFNEGYTIDDFIIVIDKKCCEWLSTEMEGYLRPETLFGTKFDGYLNQKRGGKNGKDRFGNGKISRGDRKKEEANRKYEKFFANNISELQLDSGEINRGTNFEQCEGDNELY
jgi:uncharacterized phage protein (TIGR02220 family)